MRSQRSRARRRPIGCYALRQVSGELGPTSCVGSIAGSGGAGAGAQGPAPFGMLAGEARAAAAEHAASARRAGSLGFSTEAAVEAVRAGGGSGDEGVSGTVWNASRLARGGPAAASSAAAGGGGGSKLVVNAGPQGRVTLRALSWMEAVARKVRGGGGGGGGGSGDSGNR
jgi:hypothetical protein